MGLYLTFTVDSQVMALDLEVIERVLRMAAVRQLPQVDQVIQGVIDVQGEITPVINLRRLLGLNHKDIELSDVIILCNYQNKRLFLIVDSIDYTQSTSDEYKDEKPTVPLPEAIEKFIKLQDKVVPVYQLDKLLSKIQIPANAGADSDGQHSS